MFQRFVTFSAAALGASLFLFALTAHSAEDGQAQQAGHDVQEKSGDLEKELQSSEAQEGKQGAVTTFTTNLGEKDFKVRKEVRGKQFSVSGQSHAFELDLSETGVDKDDGEAACAKDVYDEFLAAMNDHSDTATTAVAQAVDDIKIRRVKGKLLRAVVGWPAEKFAAGMSGNPQKKFFSAQNRIVVEHSGGGNKASRLKFTLTYDYDAKRNPACDSALTKALIGKFFDEAAKTLSDERSLKKMGKSINRINDSVDDYRKDLVDQKKTPAPKS